MFVPDTERGAAATGKARSPTVDDRVRRSVMMMTLNEDDLERRRGLMLGHKRRREFLVRPRRLVMMPACSRQVATVIGACKLSFVLIIMIIINLDFLMIIRTPSRRDSRISRRIFVRRKSAE